MILLIYTLRTHTRLYFDYLAIPSALLSTNQDTEILSSVSYEHGNGGINIYVIAYGCAKINMKSCA